MEYHREVAWGSILIVIAVSFLPTPVSTTRLAHSPLCFDFPPLPPLTTALARTFATSVGYPVAIHLLHLLVLSISPSTSIFISIRGTFPAAAVSISRGCTTQLRGKSLCCFIVRHHCRFYLSLHCLSLLSLVAVPLYYLCLYTHCSNLVDNTIFG